MDDRRVAPDEMSHGLLVAVLSALGGSYELRPDQLEHDAMGNTAGELHSVELEPLDNGNALLRVVARAENAR